jgi:hypothetical protein
MKIASTIIVLIISIFGFYFLWEYSESWKLVLGIALLLWGNNMEQAERFDKKLNIGSKSTQVPEI